MIQISVLYPRQDDGHFDHDYYVNSHMELVKQKLEPFGLIRSSVDKGVAGADDQPAPFVTIGYLLFDTITEGGSK